MLPKRMIEITEILNKFEETIQSRGFPSNIIWLHWNQMFLTKDKLYINFAKTFPLKEEVIKTFNKNKDKLEWGATLMLVAIEEDISYCTLLLDSYGSDEDITLEDERLYLWCSPYVKKIVKINSKVEWFVRTKIIRNYILSSLDYAF